MYIHINQNQNINTNIMKHIQIYVKKCIKIIKKKIKWLTHWVCNLFYKLDTLTKKYIYNIDFQDNHLNVISVNL